MSDSLKNFIRNNREAFDDASPADRNWKQIERSLPKMKQSFFWDSVTFWRAAAIVCFCVLIYVIVPFSKKDSSNQLSQQNDFSDLESFYSNEIAEKVELINHFDFGDDADQFTQDFQKLDAMYQVLREEMRIRPSQKVKDALVLNLLVRIDLLNQQIKKLEDKRTPSGQAASS